MKPGLSYSVVIATRNRNSYLKRTVEGLLNQRRLPHRVIVVDAAPEAQTRGWLEGQISSVSIKYIPTSVVSAARQRNIGAREVATDLIAFVDDDVDLPPNLFNQLLEPFEASLADSVGGVAGRISGLGHSRPSLGLRLVYGLLAGYSDPHYGARLFGPAINTLPYYDDRRKLIPAEWLNSTCVVYRNEVFQRELFPEFDGYSYLEDVHLSARISKTHSLFFHAEALYVHHCAGRFCPQDRAALVAMAMRNRRIVARDVLGMGHGTIMWKQFIHRLLNSLALLRIRSEGWKDELAGTWRS